MDAHQLAERGLECAEVTARKRGAAGELDRARSDSSAVTVEFVMEVRASGHAGRSDIADHLALGDALAGRHLEASHVRIGGGEAVAVIDLHIFAVPAVPADEFEDRKSVV